MCFMCFKCFILLLVFVFVRNLSLFSFLFFSVEFPVNFIDETLGFAQFGTE